MTMAMVRLVVAIWAMVRFAMVVVVVVCLEKLLSKPKGRDKSESSSGFVAKPPGRGRDLPITELWCEYNGEKAGVQANVEE